MVTRQELTTLLDSWFAPYKIKDDSFHGLQYEGKEHISKIACAVDVSLETLQKAQELEVDFLLTHHGLIWGGLSRIVSFDKKRIDVLVNSQLNLYCMHLPLDIHPTLGNNACLIDILGAESTGEIFFDVGYYANINISYKELKERIQKEVSENLVEMNFGSDFVDKVAICSGGATMNLRALFEAHEKGVHTIISGETNSLYYHYAKELGINIICAGHYATETFGVNKTIREISNIYPQLDTIFIDFPTGF